MMSTVLIGIGRPNLSFAYFSYRFNPSAPELSKMKGETGIVDKIG